MSLAQAAKLKARSTFAGLHFCALCGIQAPEDMRNELYREAAENLQILYMTPHGLQRALVTCWKDALHTIASPRGFRSAAALARHLIEHEEVIGMPDACYSRNDEPISELTVAETRLLEQLARGREEIAEAVAGIAERQAARVAERDRRALPRHH